MQKIQSFLSFKDVQRSIDYFGPRDKVKFEKVNNFNENDGDVFNNKESKTMIIQSVVDLDWTK